MARTPIRTLDTKMPHAKLYLDDLREIEEIIQRAAEPRTVTFSYVIGTDSFSEIADLAEHSGFCSEFQMLAAFSSDNEIEQILYGRPQPMMRFYSPLKPDVIVPDPLQSEEWALVAQLRTVFVSREDRIKAAILGFPAGARFMTRFMLNAICVLLIPSYLYRAVTHHTWPFLWWVILAVLFCAVSNIVHWFASRTDGVYLRYSRPTALERKRIWKERGEKLSWLLAGATVTGLAAWITGHLK